MDRQDLAARSDEVRAAGRDLMRGSVALRAYGAALRRRHPRSAAVPGEPEGDGHTSVPRDAAETDWDGRDGAHAGRGRRARPDRRGRGGRRPSGAQLGLPREAPAGGLPIRRGCEFSHRRCAITTHAAVPARREHAVHARRHPRRRARRPRRPRELRRGQRDGAAAHGFEPRGTRAGRSAAAGLLCHGGFDVVVLCPYLTAGERADFLQACAEQDPRPAVLELRDEPEALDPHVRAVAVPASRRQAAEQVLIALSPHS